MQTPDGSQTMLLDVGSVITQMELHLERSKSIATAISATSAESIVDDVTTRSFVTPLKAAVLRDYAINQESLEWYALLAGAVARQVIVSHRPCGIKGTLLAIIDPIYTSADSKPHKAYLTLDTHRNG